MVKTIKDEFSGMPETSGKARVCVKFTDGVLTIQGVSRGWKFEKDITPLEYMDECTQVEVSNEVLRKIISSQSLGFDLFLVDYEKKYIMVNRPGELYYVNHVVV